MVKAKRSQAIEEGRLPARSRRSGSEWESRATFSTYRDTFEEIVENVERVIQGKTDVIRLSLITMIGEGHLLIEDVPGVGKTMLAKAIARSTSCVWRRIQFTPDLLPSDVTGVNIYNSSSKAFEFRHGAVFANIVLGDEINRASPKTQSALLESMEERQVTLDGVTHPLSPPFMVIATQNPIEHEGTYPLPESQLDRFMMRLTVGYPDTQHSLAILDKHGTSEPVDSISPVIDVSDVMNLIDAAKRVHVADSVRHYIIALVEATRAHPSIYLGASPRSSLFLLKASRALAASEGRDFVLPDDVKALTHSVLDHRLVTSPEVQIRGATTTDVLNEVIESVAAPSR